MAEDDLLVRPKTPWYERIKWQTWLSAISFVVSLCSVVFSCQQVWIADRQANIADEARKDARTASEAQAKDVERARRAAEASAAAAEKLAEAARQTSAATQQSANAAFISAEAGRESLALSRRALILGNQPRLDTADVRLRESLAEGKIPGVITRIVNAGKGTAIRASCQQWINIAPRPFFLYTPFRHPLSTIDLPPGQNNGVTVTTDWTQPLSAELVKRINNGTLILFVYGKAEYYDETLEKARKYTWRWCEFYVPTVRHDPNALALAACNEHNNTTIE